MQAHVDENFIAQPHHFNEKLKKKKNDCLLIDACGKGSSSSKRMFLINLIAAVLREWKLN